MHRGISQVVTTILILILGITIIALSLRMAIPIINSRIDMKRYQDGKACAETIQATIEDLISCGYGCSKTIRLKLPEKAYLTIGEYTINVTIPVSKPKEGLVTLRVEPHTNLTWTSKMQNYIFTIRLKEYPPGAKWHLNHTELLLTNPLTLKFTLNNSYEIWCEG